MNPAMIFATIGKNIAELIKYWFISKKVKSKKKLDILEKRLNAQARIEEKHIDHEMDWDLVQARQSQFSWKDEFWTIVLSIPLVMCFIPGLEQYAVKGFENLERVPEWYIIAVGVAIASAFGFRQMVGFMRK